MRILAICAGVALLALAACSSNQDTGGATPAPADAPASS